MYFFRTLAFLVAAVCAVAQNQNPYSASGALDTSRGEYLGAFGNEYGSGHGSSSGFGQSGSVVPSGAVTLPVPVIPVATYGQGNQGSGSGSGCGSAAVSRTVGTTVRREGVSGGFGSSGFGGVSVTTTPFVVVAVPSVSSYHSKPYSTSLSGPNGFGTGSHGNSEVNVVAAPVQRNQAPSPGYSRPVRSVKDDLDLCVGCSGRPANLLGFSSI